MTGPFDFVRAVGHTKRHLVDEGEAAWKDYNAFLTNRAFSYHPDTVQFANTMNSMHSLDPELQHDFYLHGLPARKRYGKWGKRDKDEEVDKIAECFGINRRHAAEAVKTLTPSQVDSEIASLERGGRG